MARGHFKCHLVIVVIIFSFERGRSGGGGGHIFLSGKMALKCSKINPNF